MSVFHKIGWIFNAYEHYKNTENQNIKEWMKDDIVKAMSDLDKEGGYYAHKGWLKEKLRDMLYSLTSLFDE